MKLAHIMTRRLLSWAQSSNYDILLPNYFFGSYEIDVFKLSKSMFVTEYEIKVSKADFKKDFKKGSYYRKGLKHENLANGTGGPNRFFFVVPSGLVSASDVPVHAGLIEYTGGEWGTFHVVKNAKLLHNQKQTPDIFRRLAQTLSVREQVYREKYNRLKFK